MSRVIYTSLILISLLLCKTPVLAMGEVESTRKHIEQQNSQPIQLNAQSLKIEKNQIIEDAEKPNVVIDCLEKFHKGYTFEEGPVNYFKMGILYGDETHIFKEDGHNLGSRFSLPVFEIYTKTKFNDDKYELDTMFNTARELPNYDNYFSEKISVLSLTRNIGKNQKIIIGQASRLPIGVEGKYSGFQQDFAEKSQIGRTFSNVRSMGIRNQGNYKYVDYDIGLYDSTRYSKDYFKGLDSTGWINFKPLASKPKYGSAVIGTGYNVGHYDKDYSVLSSYLEYNYKKIHSKFEYAHANGYNSAVESTNNAEGFYAALLYDLTKKIQLTARYDCLNPNKHRHDLSNTEYTAGFVYKPFENFKVFVNYIYKDKATVPNENRVMLSTSFFF